MDDYVGRDEPAGIVADRPQMAASYGLRDATAGSGLLSWDWAITRLTQARNYWLATVRADGRPHVMPIWGIWLEGVFLFSTDRASRKGRNLAANPAATLNLESGDEVVIVEGAVAEAQDSALLGRYADAYLAKYAIQLALTNLEQVTYLLRPHVAFGWLESSFDGNATRWRLTDSRR